MIEKLNLEEVNNPGEATLKAFSILNQLVDAVNKLETMAKNTNTVLESLVQENNIHEKQIDELQMKLEPEKCGTPAENVQPDAESRLENVQDKFSEQRKWIGKLCWFWNNDNEPDTCFGVLTGLFDEADRPFERSIGQQLYRYCEPVKPDDDIIYKGGKDGI